MPFDELSSFLSDAADAGELVRIPVEVDPVFELAAVADRAGRQCSGWPPVLLFERVRGSRMPVVTHLVSAPGRLLKLLGTTTFDEAVSRLQAAFTPRFTLPDSWLESLRVFPGPQEASRLAPRVVRSGLSQQIVKLGKDVDLTELPIPQSWPGETGRTITAGQVQVQALDGQQRQVGLFAAEVSGRDSLILHCAAQDRAQLILAEFIAAGRQMPVAIALGGDPLLCYSASLPLPPQVDHFLFTGLLREENVNLVRGRTVELDVPAEAEIIIEGYVDPVEPTASSTAANPTGYLTAANHLPAMRVTAITHRANPVFPTFIRGTPPCEEHTFARLTERLLLPILKLIDGDILDVHFPEAGCYRRTAFVALKKSSPLQARRAMNALWGLPVLAMTKMLIVVDADVDLRNVNQVWQRVSTHVHPQRDVIMVEGLTDVDDHAAPVPGLGSKIGIDATRKSAAEGHSRAWPGHAGPSAEMEQLLQSRWPEYGV